MAEEFDPLRFNDTVVYSEMRPYLGEYSKSCMDESNIVVIQGRGGDILKSHILDDLAGLERKWKLL